jgi:AP-4 complex subunit epsilon-1
MLNYNSVVLKFQSLLTSAPHVLAQVLPVDASAEDVQVDTNLSFLDGFVQAALSSGANPYSKPEDDDDDDDMAVGGLAASKAPAFNMTPYESQPNQLTTLACSCGIQAARLRLLTA